MSNPALGWLCLIAAGGFTTALLCGFRVKRMTTLDAPSISGSMKQQPVLFWFAAAFNGGMAVLATLTAFKLGL